MYLSLEFELMYLPEPLKFELMTQANGPGHRGQPNKIDRAYERTEIGTIDQR